MPVRRLWLFAALLLLVGCTPIHAPTSSSSQDQDQLSVTTYTLANGLKVILAPDHSAPTVAVDVWYHVGGMNDPAQRSGFAHLFEHMMFQGSANAPKGEMDRLNEAVGGSNNAYTTIEHTSYYQVMPANQLPLALWLDADRMAALDINQVNLDNQRDVVIEEYNQRVSNSPYGEAVQTLNTLAYDYAPYHKRVIGSVADLRRASLADVTQFHNTYYAPNNATLVVAGDIDLDTARNLIAEFFGDIPAKPQPPAAPAYAPAPLSAPQVISMTDSLANVPAVLIGYSVPPRKDPDYPAVELLANILGNGNSSRLAKLLVDSGAAQEASAGTSANRGPSLFSVILVPNAGTEVATLEQQYDEALQQIVKEGVQPAELEKAINQLRSQQLAGLETAYDLAEAVQSANFYLDDPSAVFTELERYRSVTSADLQRVASQYLAPELRTVINVHPGAAAEQPPAVQATAVVTDQAMLTQTASLTPTTQTSVTFVLKQKTPPAPLPSTSFKLPNIQEKKLSNGLSVIVIERPELPLLSVDLYLPGGESAVPAAKSGLGTLTANSLTRGTQTRTAQEIAESIEQVGGFVGASVTRDLLSVGVFALKENTDLAFTLLGDVALKPTFPETEVKNQRESQATSLQFSLADPGSLAQRAFSNLVYGNHPYGNLSSAKTIQALTRQDVADFYQSQLDPQRAFLIVAGDITVDEAVQQAEKTFGQWQTTTASQPVTYPPVAAPSGQQIYLINRPGSSQAQFLIGNIGAAGNDPDRYAQAVMNDILGGGGFTSRLMQNIREKLGYTYGISSGLNYPADRGLFRISAAVRNDVADKALTAILQEVQQMQDQTISTEELNAKKTGLIGSFALQLETYQSIVDQMASLKLRGLPLDTLANYPTAIEKVTAADVQAAAQKVIQTKDFVIVVVGDASVIQKPLESVAPVKVIEAR
ncbi:MAG: pitrilysin family protein [Chloroflexi bacterium]|nr:pitrilysin family protein [Chloroflexota bacterium]